MRLHSNFYNLNSYLNLIDYWDNNYLVHLSDFSNKWKWEHRMLMLLQELDRIMYLYKYISVFLEYCLCGWHPRSHKIFYLMTLTQERQKKFYVDLVMVELPMRWHTIHFVCKFYELCNICSVSVILFHLFSSWNILEFQIIID